MQKAAAYKVQGMHRDASPTNFKPEYAFEIVNMRLITDEEGSAFSLVNEKGTLYSNITLEGGYQPLGQCSTTDSIIVFAKSSQYDGIFKITLDDKNSCSVVRLFRGNLNFNKNNPIETLFNYETEDIQKVYWIDGINPLRCINISQSNFTERGNSQFDSVLPLADNKATVDITRASGGSFKAGVIQYFATYFNKYRTESPIFWNSPLLYLANQNRGAEGDANVDTAFRFSFTGLDNANWEYIRLYSVYRTSIDTEPVASIVSEIKISGTGAETSDYGTSNTAIVASDLYFIGAKAVKAGTMTVKDQVLFLGNLEMSVQTQPKTKISKTDLNTNTAKAKAFKINEMEGTYYHYDNQLNNTESISTYKNGETYRFGYQLQDKWGNWSNPVWLGDRKITYAPQMENDNTLTLAQPSLNFASYARAFKDEGFIAIRPLVVFPDIRDRQILCQGVVCPTVYNLKDRVDNSPFAQASWFMRPSIPGDIWGNQAVPATGHLIDSGSNPSYNGLLDKHLIGSDGSTSSTFNITRASLLLDEVPNSTTVTELFPGIVHKDIVTDGAWVEFRHNYALKTKGHSYGKAITTNIAGYPGINKDLNDKDRVNANSEYYGLARGAEIDSTRGIATIPVNRFLGNEANKFNNEDVTKYNTGSSAYYVDSSIVTFNSPEIELSEDLYTLPVDNYKFRIVGLVPLTANIADMSLETDSPSLYTHPQQPNKELGFNKLKIHTENIGYTGYRGLVAANPYLAWFHKKTTDENGSVVNVNTPNGNIIAGHLLYPWQSTGNIQTFMASDERRTNYSKLKRKVLSNSRFSAISYYLPEDDWWLPSFGDTTSILAWTSTENSIQKFFLEESLKLPDIVYKGNIDSLAMQDINGSSYDLYYYTGSSSFNGDNTSDIVTVDDNIFYLPTFTTNSNLVQKGQSIASSIKYKSSPHFAIFLGGKYLSGPEKTIVETLPTLSTKKVKYNYEVGFDSNSEDKYHGRGWIDGIEYFWEAKIEANSSITLNDADNQFFANIKTLEADSVTEDGYSLPSRLRVRIELQLYSDTYKYLHQALTTVGTYFSSVQSFNERNDKAKIYYVDPDSGSDTGNSKSFNYYKIESRFLETDNRTSVSITLIDYGDTSEENEYHTITFSSYRNRIEDSEIRLNQVGIPETTLEMYSVARNTSLNFGRVYESADVASLSLQKSIHLGETLLNLPKNYYPQPTTIANNPINYGWLWLGEIYKEQVPTFGGTSEYALQNNKWEIAGNTVSLNDANATLEWSIGDTYYQRFDTLKTYAYADTDENSVIDITSFMVETRLNIDGRYDRNRGQENNLNMSPRNFNLFNKVYTQRNNFFTYSITPEDAAKRLKFPTQITWSLMKTPGENIDQWLNTTLTSLIDLDGRKGSLTALKTMQNEIMAFQEKGIANVIYNPRTQITATDGTPIYIANSAKVEGFKYITDNVGSQDKWSIVSSPNGLYFVDLYNKGIYKFNGQIEDISNAQGFHSWCAQNLNKNSKILGYYDYKNKDVYFINSAWTYPCLAFSEFTNSFSSFYSYKGARLLYLQGEGLWLTDNGGIYLHQKGNYNSFFGSNEDYHVTIVCNQDGNLSKIFNTVEFRADSWSGAIRQDFQTIDYLSIETSHQALATQNFDFNHYTPSSFKKKFNVWRVNIPRVSNSFARYRDVWAKITLGGGKNNTRKTRLNDIVVYYT